MHIKAIQKYTTPHKTHMHGTQERGTVQHTGVVEELWNINMQEHKVELSRNRRQQYARGAEVHRSRK